MPTFSPSLEKALHQALNLANERRQSYSTLEHLLLALLDDQDAATTMRACDVDLDLLRRNLVEYVDDELENLVTDDDDDAKPTAGFQRVIQRAVIHVQSAGLEEVSGANVLVAIFAERESHAAYFLQEQDMTRYDAVNWVSHGIAKRVGMSEARPPRGVEEESEETTAQKKGGIKSDKNPTDNKKTSTNNKKLDATRIKIEKRLRSKKSLDAIGAASLCILLKEIASGEIKNLENLRPNSPELCAEIDAKIDLLKLFQDSFEKIAILLNQIAERKTNKRINDAANEVYTLSKSLKEWWNKNNQKCINYGVGAPIIIGSLEVVKLLGADSSVQLFTTGLTASYWLGSDAIKSAIATVKGLKD